MQLVTSSPQGHQLMPTMTFPGHFASLAKISEFVARGAQEAGLDDRAAYEVQLAVDEACANIIDHAYGGESKGKIECTYEVINKGLKVILRDRGQSFDPDGVETPDFRKKSLEELPSRGAGMTILRKAVDEVTFDFSPDEGNTLVLIKRK